MIFSASSDNFVKVAIDNQTSLLLLRLRCVCQNQNKKNHFLWIKPPKGEGGDSAMLVMHKHK
jgi:hypothetical protein